MEAGSRYYFFRPATWRLAPGMFVLGQQHGGWFQVCLYLGQQHGGWFQVCFFFRPATWRLVPGMFVFRPATWRLGPGMFVLGQQHGGC